MMLFPVRTDVHRAGRIVNCLVLKLLGGGLRAKKEESVKENVEKGLKNAMKGVLILPPDQRSSQSVITINHAKVHVSLKRKTVMRYALNIQVGALKVRRSQSAGKSVERDLKIARIGVLIRLLALL